MINTAHIDPLKYTHFEKDSDELLKKPNLMNLNMVQEQSKDEDLKSIKNQISKGKENETTGRNSIVLEDICQ